MKNRKNFIPAKKGSTERVSQIESLLRPTARSLRIATKLDRYKAFPVWPEIVGDEIAEVAIPEKIIRSNILVVRVIDITWAQELSLRKDEILDKIHHRGIGAHIDDIRFVVGNPRSFKKDKS